MLYGRVLHPDGAMWDVYPPTPMTGEWLVENGYWDGVTEVKGWYAITFSISVT